MMFSEYFCDLFVIQNGGLQFLVYFEIQDCVDNVNKEALNESLSKFSKHGLKREKYMWHMFCHVYASLVVLCRCGTFSEMSVTHSIMSM